VADDVAGFYDALSESYHLSSRNWPEAVEGFGAGFDSLLQRLLGGPGPFDVLDCSCGIGQQALGLARRGHRVHGSDLSAASLARAERDARELGVELTTSVADMRRIDVEVGGDWDAVLSAGNSLAHLDSQGLREVAGAARRILRPGGVFLAGVRDYDQIAPARPRIQSGQVHDTEAGKRIIFQVWDWTLEGDAYVLNYFVVQESEDGWDVRRERSLLHAHRRADVVSALEDAGLAEVTAHDLDIGIGTHLVVSGRADG
jgi:glycine/sarcosine N-methyltransferase